MSVAIAQVLGSALQGKCKDRPSWSTPIPLEARLEVLPVRGGERFLHEIFEPLGYGSPPSGTSLDEKFPDWGPEPVLLGDHREDDDAGRAADAPVRADSRASTTPSTTSSARTSSTSCVEKGQGWLDAHPLKELIARRFLKFQSSLYREALSRLVEEEQPEEADETTPPEQAEEALERPISLNEQRLGGSAGGAAGSGARRVLDLGCGEGKLLRELLKDRQFEQIVGMDVSIRTLEVAKDRLRLERLPPHAGRANQAAARLADLPRQAAAWLRRRRRRRGHRASRPAAALRLRASAVRVRPAADASC